MTRPLLTTIAFGAFWCVAFAQPKTIVLIAARMFDGRDVRTPGLVVINGSGIVGVGPATPIPAGAEIIDLGDATLSPGFIDAHTHLSMMYNADYRQGQLDALQKTVPERTLLATANLKKTLMAGVTTARDVGSDDYMDVGLRNAAAGRHDSGTPHAGGGALDRFPRRPL